MPRHHRRTGTNGSEGDEDAPLVMTSLNGTVKKELDEVLSHSRGRREVVNGVRSLVRRRRSKSISSLGSEEDLLKRRMQGLTFSLMGNEI